MKRILLTILLIILLTGCHAQRFTYGDSQINIENDLDDILELMMDKGNYSDNTLVPYSLASLAIDYSTYQVNVEAIQFQVYRKFDGEEYHYDYTACFDVDGVLECKEERGKFTSTEQIEEIELSEAFDVFSTMDIPGIMNELTTKFSFVRRENLLFQAHLAKPNLIQDKVERFDNIVYYYDDQYHYDDTYEPTEMMLEIRVNSFGDGEGDTYIFYFEIE